MNITSKLGALPNLHLAWKRITSGGNYQYKRFFRPLYYSYDLALEDNLKDLHARLKAGTYTACSPSRVYLPKPSGLQRPLTLLGLEDQIVLQAIANHFAERTRKKRSSLELKSVFSNVLNPKTGEGKIFFFRDWHLTYSAFQRKTIEYYKGGFKWMVTFDLAAFYDTISHVLLLNVIHRDPDRRDDMKVILSWLKKWSSEQAGATFAHGIPQGPIASDWLSESFMLPIDLVLQKRKIKYVRYVDDIKIFSKTETEVQKFLLAFTRRNRSAV